jgi:filamin
VVLFVLLSSCSPLNIYIYYNFVFLLQLRGMEGATPGQPFSFTVDASGTGGLGDVCLDIVSGGRSVPHRMESLGGSLYRVSLVPKQAGKHRVYVYFNGGDVKG